MNENQCDCWTNGFGVEAEGMVVVDYGTDKVSITWSGDTNATGHLKTIPETASTQRELRAYRIGLAILDHIENHPKE